MVCPECGTEIDDPRAFCPYCGAPLREAPADHPLWEALFPCLIALGMAAGTLWWAWQAARGSLIWVLPEKAWSAWSPTVREKN